MTTAETRAAQARLDATRDALNDRYAEEHRAHKTGERPWGSEAWLAWREEFIDPVRAQVENRMADVIATIMSDR